MAKKTEVTIVPLKSVVPDENQPRKYFDAQKLKTLADSIKKYGIISPIIVQEFGTGKYLIEDGERRYRAATLLGLTEVPVVIREATSATERLIQQFNIQEQHAEWTPVEKAVAITALANELKMSLQQVTKMLNVTRDIAHLYVAFAQLVDKDIFVRSEIPLNYAIGMQSVKNRAKLTTKKELEKDFLRSDEKKLEARMVHLIKTGIIIGQSDFSKLSDSFTKDPKAIDKFLNDPKATPVSLFAETKAKGAYNLRNALITARYFSTHGTAFLELRDVKLTPQHLSTFKMAMRTAQALIDLGKAE